MEDVGKSVGAGLGIYHREGAAGESSRSDITMNVAGFALAAIFHTAGAGFDIRNPNWFTLHSIYADTFVVTGLIAGMDIGAQLLPADVKSVSKKVGIPGFLRGMVIGGALAVAYHGQYWDLKLLPLAIPIAPIALSIRNEIFVGD